MLLQTSDVNIKTVSANKTKGVFEFSPLPKDFGHTLGNSLRRILLTSLRGSAVTSVKFPGVTHRFSTIKGIKEDVVEICLNLKELHAKIDSEHPVVATISKKGAGPVLASDIQVSSEVEIINKDLVIATIGDAKGEFEAELILEAGEGYSPLEDRKTSKVGVLLVDAVFSPVVSVSYSVDSTRKGDLNNLDKLTIEVETNGTLMPEEAIVEAATILRNFFSRFAKGADHEAAELEDDSEAAVTGSRNLSLPRKDVFLDDLDLPTRTVNALKNANVSTLGELAALTDEELSDVKNLGSKSVLEIKKLLKKEGFN